VLWARSVAALAEEMDRCAALGIGDLVVHPGAHMGAGEAAGLRRVLRALDRLTARRGPTRVLLEITAGQGTVLGARFEHLGGLLRAAARPARLGVCFDTCHALAAGYEFRDRAAYRRTMALLDRHVGLERVRAFHLNDSQAGLGSRRDRHAHIGSGEIGLEAFRCIVNDPRFRDVPKILETPKGDDLAEDRRNLSVLRDLLKT
jgi:deoxyribonuclease-4